MNDADFLREIASELSDECDRAEIRQIADTLERRARSPYYCSTYPDGRTAVCEGATGRIVQWVEEQK